MDENWLTEEVQVVSAVVKGADIRIWRAPLGLGFRELESGQMVADYAPTLESVLSVQIEIVGASIVAKA